MLSLHKINRLPGYQDHTDYVAMVIDALPRKLRKFSAIKFICDCNTP